MEKVMGREMPRKVLSRERLRRKTKLAIKRLERESETRVRITNSEAKRERLTG